MKIRLGSLSPAPGSRHRRKRIGCGEGSGHGGSSTRGMKGQRSRSGDGKQIGFEGGQMPLLRRIPKRGFTNPFRQSYAVVNLRDLERVFGPNQEVNPQSLGSLRLVRTQGPVKILGQGDLTKPLKVSAHRFSKEAREKIEKAGGSVTLL